MIILQKEIVLIDNTKTKGKGNNNHMVITIKNKFNIGDIVQRYVTQLVYDEEIECPICKGNYMMANPNFDMFNDKNEYLFCNCCTLGKIQVNSRMEKVLTPECYVVDGLTVSVSSNFTSHKYQLTSTPELNGGAGYMSTVADECELELFEAQGHFK